MTRTNLVFKDLQDYIQKAERDSGGMHFPFQKTDNSPSLYAFHIYQGLNQVNICRRSADGYQMDSIANFVFDDDEVSVISVSKYGVADYDNPLRIPVTTAIDTPMGLKEPLPEIAIWRSHLGITGGVVKEVLRDVLWPIVSKQ